MTHFFQKVQGKNSIPWKLEMVSLWSGFHIPGREIYSLHNWANLGPHCLCNVIMGYTSPPSLDCQGRKVTVARGFQSIQSVVT